MIRQLLAFTPVAVVCLAAAPAPNPTSAPPPIQAGSDPIRGLAAISAEFEHTGASDPVAAVTGNAATDSLPLYVKAMRNDPLAAFALGVNRVREEIHGYRATLIKRERVQGKLGEKEVIRVAGRAEPFSVLMLWQEGARETLGTKTEGTLFVAGENGGKIKAWRPASFLAALRFMDVAPGDDRARASSRYIITEGGLLTANERTLRTWTESRDRDPGSWRSRWKYLGVLPVAEVGGRRCHVVERTSDPPEIDPFTVKDPPPDPKKHAADAYAHVRVYMDAETWLQVGAELKRADGEWIGYYHFKDIELNPKFPADYFTPASFKK